MAADVNRSFSIRIVDWAQGIAQLRAVRVAVFVVEQNIPEDLEWDDEDARRCTRLPRTSAGNAIGCGRLLRDGHIGRMAVLASWRGRGVGGALLDRLVALARERGHARVVLNAQTQAMPFYARHGFAPVGAPFVEAGIAHHAMARTLT